MKEKINNYENIFDLEKLNKKMNESIKRHDNELEELIFQDAKKNEKLKDVYSAFIKLRDAFNQLQKNIVDTNVAKERMKKAENKVQDYKQKLEGYDLKQLKEQVEYLKSLQ